MLLLQPQDRVVYLLKNQRLAKIVCTVFNVINNEHAPKSIRELIGFRNNKYNLRGSDILKRPKASTTTYGLKSWRFTATKLWNSLPDSSRTVRTFKSAYDMKNIFCLFERPFKIKKNGVFLFEISFFVLEILTFFYYAN